MDSPGYGLLEVTGYGSMLKSAPKISTQMGENGKTFPLIIVLDCAQQFCATSSCLLCVLCTGDLVC